jgi:hypothetical protein
LAKHGSTNQNKVGGDISIMVEKRATKTSLLCKNIEKRDKSIILQFSGSNKLTKHLQQARELFIQERKGPILSH